MKAKLFPILLACASVSASALGCGASPTPAPTSPEPSGAVAVASGAPTDGAPAADGKTRFTFVLASAGATRTDVETFSVMMDMSVSDGGKVVGTEKSGDTKKMIRHTTVIENNGKAITKKKVRYEEMVKVTKKGERELSVPSPLTGKTYLLAFDNGRIVTTSAEGEPISDIERDALLDDNKELGKPPMFATFLPGMPLSPGEKFTPPPDALGDLSGSQGAGKSYSDVEFTYVGAEERGSKRVNRFDFSMTIEDKTSPLTMNIRLQGTVRLMSDTGWPADAALKGAITVSGPGKKPSQKVEGAGVIEAKKEAKYE